MTFRPLNQCNSCESTWHPRGKDVSSRCPSCGSRDVDIVRPSSSLPGCAPIVVVSIGFIFLVGWFGSHLHSPSSGADSSTSSAVEASSSVAVTPTPDITSDAATTAGNSVAASDATEPASAPSAEGIAKPNGDEAPATAAPQASVEGPHPATTFPTTFDCTKASHDDEIAVCDDPGLAAMDRQLGQLYDAALRTISDPQALAKSESDWLLTRHVCDKDLECLRHLYGERIGQFLGSLGSKPLIPALTDAEKP